jgi:hypothetical protein
MGIKEWSINLMLMSLLANAFLFILIPNNYPDSSLFACTKVLFNATGSDFDQYFSSIDSKMVGSCSASFITSPDITGVTQASDLVEQTIGLLFALPGIILYIMSLLVVILYLIFNLLLTGWLNIYNVLFSAWAKEISTVLFGIVVLVTGIMLFGVSEYLLDMIARIRGLKGL